MTDRFTELDRLFEAALDVPESERADFLAARVADPEVRRELEALLADAGAADTLLPPAGALEGALGEAFALELAVRAAPGEVAAAGTTIEDYRLVRRLGRGGMGEVWEAEQLAPVRRKVALKLVRSGLDSEQVLARFRSERQALALMSHPNIARVYDGGATPSGRPYFVMECVDGLPVTEYCDRERLSIGRRLELFLDICDGVQHAHQRGVVHRDLKPSNLLVGIEDGRPVPKIIDFGIARALDERLDQRSVFTQFGELIGTPEYMSPEQAGGDPADVDTRADVYALGVVLYELLAGARPFDSETLRGAGFLELLKTVREVEPPRPSQRLAALPPAALDQVAAERAEPPQALVRRLRGDLDWIAARALEKDRERRYGSPQELAADLRRHLADEPVAAGPPSTGYRLRKLIRRHRVAFATASLVAAALVLGAGVATWQAIRATRAEAAARADAATAREVADFLIGLFEVSDPGIARGGDPTAREILARGRERIEGDLAGQPLVRARLMLLIADVYRKLGHYDEARPLLEQALASRTELLGAADAEVARARLALARLESDRADDARAEQLFHEAHAGLAAALGATDVETVSVLHDLADVMRRSGRHAEAEELYRRSIEAFTTALGAEHPHVASAVNGLGTALYRQGRFAEAVAAFERALELRERLLGADHPDVAVTLLGLGPALGMLGRDAEAEGVMRRAVEVNERVYGGEHRIVASALTNLGGVLGRQGRLDEAEAVYARALAIRARVFGPDHPETALDYKNLGLVYSLKAEYERAGHFLERTLAIDRASLGADHPRVIWDLVTLGGLQVRRARFAEAEASFTAALATAERVLGPAHPDVGRALRGRARVALERGRPQAAAELLRRALPLFEALGAESPELPPTLDLLAEVHLARGAVAEARAALERSLALRARIQRAEHPAVAETLVRMGDLQRTTGELEAAEESFRRALAIAEAALGAEHPEVARALHGLGLALAAGPANAAAFEPLERALAIRRGVLGESHPDTRRTAAELARLAAPRGRG